MLCNVIFYPFVTHYYCNECSLKTLGFGQKTIQKFILQQENHLFLLVHLGADLAVQFASLPTAPSPRALCSINSLSKCSQHPGGDTSSNCRDLVSYPMCGGHHPTGWPRGHHPMPAPALGPSCPLHLSTTGSASHTARLAEPPDSFLSTPPADVFGGTRCSDKVTHPEKAHTAGAPGAAAAAAARSSFSFLPSQMSPKHFCLIFLKDIELLSIWREEP